jgi:hypothetical protein
MLNSFYDLLSKILSRDGVNVTASSIWNFDESALKMEFCRKLCYGITGASWQKGESIGSAKHVTLGLFINTIGKTLEKDYFPTFLTTGNKTVEGTFKGGKSIDG